MHPPKQKRPQRNSSRSFLVVIGMLVYGVLTMLMTMYGYDTATLMPLSIAIMVGIPQLFRKS